MIQVFPPSVESLVDDVTACVICSHLAGAASFSLLGERKTLGIAPHAHASEKAYLASTVCHGQHDVFVSNGSCIRLGNMMEHTRAVSDAMSASNSFFPLSFLSLFNTTKCDQSRDEHGWVNLSKLLKNCSYFTPKSKERLFY